MEVQVISKTVQKFNGESFYLCGNYFQHKGKRLHRTVWEYHNGAIPKGYHVHHKDGDRCNNKIENLALMQGAAHMSKHMQEPTRKANARENIKQAIKAAPEWHRSEEGRKWHSQHGKEVWENKKPFTFTCDNCGKVFEQMASTTKGNHFCSNNCKAAARRKSGVDNETRRCDYCGGEFVVNKYSKQKCCSKECAVKRRRRDEG